MKKHSGKRAFLWPYIVPLLAGGLLGSYLMDHSKMTQEYKLAVHGVHALSDFDTDDSASLREYLKARVYYYSAYVPAPLLLKEHDHGPVDGEQLKGVSPVKDAFNPESDYRDFRRRAQ